MKRDTSTPSARLGTPIVSLADALELLEEPGDGQYVSLTFDDGTGTSWTRRSRSSRTPGRRGDLRDHRGAEPEHDVPLVHVSSVGAELGRRRSPTAPRPGGGRVPHAHACLVALLHLDAGIARDEIFGSKRELDRRLPVPVTVLSYPAGRFGPREEAFAAEAGYRAAVGTGPGLNLGAEPIRFRLRRTLVRPRLSDREFEAVLGGALDGSALRAAPRRSEPEQKVRR